MSDSLQFDLLPREYAPPRENREINLSIAVAIALLVGLCSALSNVSANLIATRREEDLARIERAYAPELEGARSRLQQLQSRGVRLAQILGERGFGSQELADVSDALRGHGWLTQLKYDAASQLVTLAGYTLKTRDLPEVMAGLWKIRSLGDVRTVSVSRQTLRDRDVIAFLLTARQLPRSAASGAATTEAAR
ncbi:MAG: hypothetical protein HY303_02480 [Candidatus Wallbacteria bacterium]|nr:hypothetical protein [Candidatus Wallbacteria bacterium]